MTVTSWRTSGRKISYVCSGVKNRERPAPWATALRTDRPTAALVKASCTRYTLPGDGRSVSGARRFLGSRARRRHARARGEAGFALLEVVIAFSVLLLALTGIGLEMGTQDSSVTASHNEQTGDAVLNRLLDEARALPYTVVAKGLSSSDTTAASTSTYISKVGPGTSIWVLQDAALSGGNGTGEVINHYSPPTGLTPPPPFYEHKSCFSSRGSSTTCAAAHFFTALTFPTKYRSKVATNETKTWLNKVIRVTVLVSWTAPGGGNPTTLSGQTLIFGKTTSCTSLGSLTAPSQASCEPDFTGGAFAGGGIIAIKPAAVGVQAIKGVYFTRFDLVLPGTSSNEALTETSTVLGTANSSGGTVDPTSSLDQESLVITKATNDLATGTSDDQSLTLTQTAAALTSTSATSAYSVTASPSSTDGGTSTSTTSASTVHACTNFTGALVTSGLPCGFGRVAQGATAALAAKLGPAGVATLATVAATSTHPDRVLTQRYARDASLTCPTAAKAGCISAASRGGLGTVELAGIPAAVVATPPGWAGYLDKLSGFRARATTWARSAKTPWLTGQITTVTGTVSYYTGSGYATLAVGGSGQAVPFSTVHVTTGAVAVTISSHLSVGGASCSETTTSARPSTVHRVACSVTPLSGTVTYVVTDGTTTIADFTLTVGLGTVSASASYQVAT